MPYDVVGLLGRGGSAVIELAVDGNGRRVATKRLVLTGSVTQIHVARQRLRREAEILSSLAHPGIVGILDVVDDGSEVILVLPLLAESLDDRVARLGPLPPAEVARVGRILIGALAAAHRQGVVHRDIKPANVLFDHRGAPALADFGVAVTREVTAGLTQSGFVVGTPMWMAPEQARGQPAGPASDVFSLAATLSFAATGEGPYRPGPPETVMARAAREEIRPVPDAVASVLRRPLTRMLEPRPERRPSAAGVLGGLNGTVLARPADRLRPGRRQQAPASLRRAGRRWMSALLGDPHWAKPSRRRRIVSVIVGLVSLAVVISVVGIGLSASQANGRRAGVRARPAAPAARPAPLCTYQQFQPCGQAQPAPHTDGWSCAPGWYDVNGLAVDGCEAYADYRPGTVLVAARPARANLLPAAATDVFTTHVSGNAFHLCWGALHLTLTAPAGTADQLTVWEGTQVVATAQSVSGSPGTATVHKPTCFGSDSEMLRVTVSAASGESGTDFSLTRDGGW